MTTERRNELDKIISAHTKEFTENANTEGRFGVLYLSCDIDTDNVQMSLECAREPFVRMLVSLMSTNRLVAEDVIRAVNLYEPNDPLNLKSIAGQ